MYNFTLSLNKTFGVTYKGEKYILKYSLVMLFLY